jgi:hypothetical protein
MTMQIGWERRYLSAIEINLTDKTMSNMMQKLLATKFIQLVTSCTQAFNKLNFKELNAWVFIFKAVALQVCNIIGYSF